MGIRRTVVSASAVTLGFSLLVGALVLRVQLRESLERAIGEETLTRAQGVAALVRTGEFGAVLAQSERTPAWVQVVDPTGAVVASTANVRSLPRPFIAVPTSLRPLLRRTRGLPIDTGERVVVASIPVPSSDGVLTVLAASPLDLADATDIRVVRSLVVIFPLLLLFASCVVWAAMRRAFRPVEAIRKEMATISASDLKRRVPVPPSDDEIAHLAATMNDTLARLESAVTRQRRFVADASHELRSPLASLRNQLEASVIGHTDPEWASTVADMTIDHERLERLVADLLLLARRDEGEQLVREPVDVGYLVRSELARRPIPDGQTRRVDADNVLVNGNADALARLLRNLVENAERHTQSVVHVTVRAVGGDAHIVVADDGSGIAETDRSAVFERFSRLDEARSFDTGGSGLGLAIVAEMVAEHGGTVSIEPSTVGARFIVRLPVLSSSV